MSKRAGIKLNYHAIARIKRSRTDHSGLPDFWNSLAQASKRRKSQASKQHRRFQKIRYSKLSRKMKKRDVRQNSAKKKVMSSEFRVPISDFSKLPKSVILLVS